MKTKVLLLITRLDRGGSAELTMQTAKGLAEKNYEVSLITGRTKQTAWDIFQYSRQNHFHLEIIHSLVRNINPLNDFLAFWQIYFIIKRVHPDILHTNSSKAGILGRIAGYFAGVPIIVHSPHGHIFYGYYSKPISKLFILAEKFTAHFTDIIFNLTEYGKQDHIKEKIANPSKFIVSSCAVDLVPFNQFQPRNFPSGTITICWIGRLTKIKNPELIINIVKILKDSDYKFEFRIIGDGELLKPLQNLVKKYHFTNVTFTGYLTNIISEFKNSNIFLITSKNEGFGRVIVEAMAAGLPVIASNVGGIPELITQNENGFLCPFDKPEKFATEIINLVSNPTQYERISKNNLIKSKQYSINNYVDNLIKTYNSVMPKVE